jgi:hypothetical protein
MIIIVVFLLSFFFQSDNIILIYHWTKMHIQSIGQSNCIYHSEQKKKKSIVMVWRVRTSFLSFFSLSHECIYLISRHIAIGRKKKTRTYIYIHIRNTNCLVRPVKRERERERWVIEKKSRWMHILSKESCSFAIFLFAYRFGHT